MQGPTQTPDSNVRTALCKTAQAFSRHSSPSKVHGEVDAGVSKHCNVLIIELHSVSQVQRQLFVPLVVLCQLRV